MPIISYSEIRIKNSIKKISMCICGINHYYADCFYIVLHKIPTKWEKIRLCVLKSMNWRKNLQIQIIDIGNIYITTNFYQTNNNFCNWLLWRFFFLVIATNKSKFINISVNDGGANIHVCNNELAHLYIQFKNSDDIFIITANGKIKINH